MAFLPPPHQPSAQECGLFCRSRSQPTQMSRRARRYLNAEFLVQLTCERVQL